MMTGETLYEEEEQDEDYLDPSYLHTAAELYDNPELYFEMQSQWEDAHGPSGHAHMHSQYGNPIFTLQDSAFLSDSTDFATIKDTGSYHGARHDVSPIPGSSAAESLELSPQQYSMLLNSMQDPLAMHTSSHMGTGKSSSDPQEMFSVSPVYGGADMDYSDHPAFAMMNIGYPSSTYSPSHRKPGF